MKRFIGLFIATFFILSACNNKKAKEPVTENKDNNTTTTNGNTGDNNSNNSAGDMNKMMEEMKKKPALSTDQLKAMLPENLMGMKRASFSANSMMGYGVGEARYKSDDGKELKVMIYDCVGEAGVGIYNLMFWGAMNMESEDENGYKKSVSFNGGKAVETYEKNNEKYSLMYTSGKRLLVNVEGEHTGLDEVKQAAQSLNLTTN